MRVINMRPTSSNPAYTWVDKLKAIGCQVDVKTYLSGRLSYGIAKGSALVMLETAPYTVVSRYIWKVDADMQEILDVLVQTGAAEVAVK